jgi:hypothetical protein
MIKYLLILGFMLCAAVSIDAQQSTNSHARIIIFKSPGQKERVKIGERVSVVLGTDVKPEYMSLKRMSFFTRK